MLRNQSQISLSVVFHLLGWLLILESVMMVVPTVVALFERSSDSLPFAASAALTALVGGVLAIWLKDAPTELNRREGYLLTSLVWVLFSIFGMLPLIFSSSALSVTDAFFETMSGFTTTGASVIEDVEACSDAVLLWRAMIQWIGGLGILLFILAVLPAFNQSGGLSVFNAESTGITHDKLHPRIRSTAASLWHVYIMLTVMMILLLWMGPMNLFESVCYSFATISTGGFVVSNAGLASFGSRYVIVVVAVFMFLGGVNFTLIYSLFRGNVRALWRNDVFRAYVTIILGCYVAVVGYLWLSGSELNLDTALLNPIFQILSAISSAGFSYLGFDSWGSFGLMIIMIVMTIGACAGSTTGAVKVDRTLALAKHLANELYRSVYPRNVRRVEVNGRSLSPELLSRTVAFISIYLVITVIGILIVSATGVDLTDANFVALSAIGTNGLGYGLTAASYAPLTDVAKWTLSAMMLIGRLEIFTVLTLLTAAFWRR
jgi:trk system potassium uptake protein TrkH